MNANIGPFINILESNFVAKLPKKKEHWQPQDSIYWDEIAYRATKFTTEFYVGKARNQSFAQETVGMVELYDYDSTNNSNNSSNNIGEIRIISSFFLEAHKVVVVTENGQYEYADSLNIAHRNGLIGLTKQAGQEIPVAINGVISDDSWDFQIGMPIFLGRNGELTQNVPREGLNWKMATVIHNNTILFNPSEAIKLI